jgi:hypothetical protein
MSGALPHLKAGPATYTAGGLILGGQLVVPASGLTGPLAALNQVGVLVCPAAYTPGSNGYPLGIAATDANNSQFSNMDASGYGPMSGATLPTNWAGIGGSNSTEDQVLDASILGFSVAVYNNVEMRVNFDGACVFGQPITWSATVAGAVTTTSSTDPKVIIGKCTQPGGVTAAGLGLAYIRA